MDRKAAGVLEKLKGWFFSLRSREKDPITLYLVLTLAGAAMIAAISFWIYNRTHLFDDYRVIESVTENDVEGTQYAMLGNRIIKYSHDGVFCVTASNSTEWSTAYSMQTPVSDICEHTMVIAEQQGEQVYLVNTKGVLGSFRTSLPIMKAKVSSKGVTALVLGDHDVTWINLYTPDGAVIASVKTTLKDSGYPVDIALSANARKMMVSFVGEEDGVLTGKVVFYDFSSADASDESHVAGSASYPGTVFPEVYFAASQTAVAVADDGYAVFSMGRRITEKRRVTFHEEIISSFHDDINIGFVFRSTDPDKKYRMAVYNLNGKETMQTEFNDEYTAIRMEDGEILLQNASDLYIYRTSGKPKLAVAYDKEVLYFDSLSGLRKYRVITDNSMDRIRIR